jgi:hypothetical protein
MSPVPITTDVVRSNPTQGEVYNIMWYSLSVTYSRSVVFSGYSNQTNQTNLTLEHVCFKNEIQYAKLTPSFYVTIPSVSDVIYNRAYWYKSDNSFSVNATFVNKKYHL